MLLVNTYHHVEERPAYFARLQTDLEPSGRVAVIYARAASFDFLPVQIFDVFTPESGTTQPAASASP